MHDSAGYRNAFRQALIEENGYSLLKINNSVYSVSKPVPWGRLSKSYSALHFLLRALHGWCYWRMQEHILLNAPYSKNVP
jgi:hypothetical protein